jgi:hypothetical protein
MITFSSTDAALEGFRLTRERPRALMTWALLQFAVSLASAGLMIGLGGQHLMAIEQAGTAGDADPAAMLAELRALAPLYAVILPVGLAVMAIMAAAVYRAVLEPDNDRTGYLRLGADELRLALLKLIYVLLWGAIVFAVVLVAALTAAAAAAFGGGVGRFAGLCIGVFAIGLLTYIAVRLSLAPAITFAEHRIAVFDSWKLTRGMFWRLAGAYSLAVAAIVVVALLGLVIFIAIAAVIVIMTGGQMADAGRAFNPDTSSIGSYFTGLTIAYLAFAAVLSALYYAVVTAPGAVAYRALAAARQTPAP